MKPIHSLHKSTFSHANTMFKDFPPSIKGTFSVWHLVHKLVQKMIFFLYKGGSSFLHSEGGNDEQKVQCLYQKIMTVLKNQMKKIKTFYLSRGYSPFGIKVCFP